MAQPDSIPISLPPGMVMTQAPIAASGRYIGGNWIRFWRGKPQKAGGWLALTSTPMIGIPRGAGAWTDSASRQLLTFGTNAKLYYIPNTDFGVNDITPWRTSATVANPLSTFAGSNIVSITYLNHGALVGDYVDISGSTLVDNFNPNGTWQIGQVPDANHVYITAPQAANNTVPAGGGAAVTVGFEIHVGLVDPASGFGWGAGGFGVGTWGTPRDISAISFSPRVWTFGNFGKILIACPGNESVYSFDPTAPFGTRAAKIVGDSGTGNPSPTYVSGVVVTAERIVIAYGSDYNPATLNGGGAPSQNLMQYWASAQGDYLNWDTTAIAGPQGAPSTVNTLYEGTRIVGGCDLGVHITLLWTDTALYELQYTGSQFVFNVQLAGKECGLIGPQAFVIVGTTAYWIGPNGLFLFNGGVQRIPNYQDVSEWIFQQLRPLFTVKTFAWYNQRFDEVWFAFVPNGYTETAAYVAVSLADWSWTTGFFPVTIFTTATRFTGYDTRPVLAGNDGVVYQHDNGLDANGTALPYSLISSPVEIAKGIAMFEVDGIAMDMQRQAGTLAATLTAYDRTPANLVSIDTMTQNVDPVPNVIDFRTAGRSIAMTLAGSGAGCDFRLGVPKLLVTQGGARR